ncbi:unnamed protein product, partial [Symbiodinium pilosum]
ANAAGLLDMALVPSERLPDSAKWSVSYVEASKAQVRRRQDEEKTARWNAGNHDSTEFFRKMGQTMADTERYKAACRSATLASPSRQNEEKVSLEFAGRYVDIAKALADFSNVCINDDEQKGFKTMNADGTVDAPPGVMHLKDPAAEEKRRQAEEEAATKVQAMERGRKARKQVKEVQEVEEEEPSQELGQGSSSSLPKEGSEEVAPPAPRPPDSVDEEGVERKSSASDNDNDDAFGEIEEEFSPKTDVVGPVISIVGAGAVAPANTSNPGSRRNSRRSSEESESGGESEGSDQNDDWPPKPPIVRFRAQCEFSAQFKAPEAKEERRRSIQQAQERKQLKVQASEVIQDMTLTWINMYFKLDVVNPRDLTAGFPIIILTMMDVIYPKKVRWHQVDWNVAYQRALTHNHRVLEKHWNEVNMDKVKDLRKDRIGMVIESTLEASIEDKLHFLKQVKRWFDCRVQHSAAYDPIKRRTEVEKQIRLTGRLMKFPTWMQYDKEEVQASRSIKPDAHKRRSQKTEATTEYENMPEFKRLLWFLGSEHQTM